MSTNASRRDHEPGSQTSLSPASKAALWTGRALSALPAALLIMSGVMKITQNAQVVEGFAQLGFDPKLALSIGIIELACTLLYLIPRTAAVGAILLTGYLGGAVVTHVRVGDPWFMPIVIGVVLWIGLVLRQPRLRSVLPW